MSKSSTVTSRDQPVSGVTAVSGSLRAHGEIFSLETSERIEVIDLTERIVTLVRAVGVKEGLVNLFSLHTTCSVFINEFQNALLADIKTFLERMVARDGEWLHNDPAHSDCDRMNADAHLRAMLLGQSLTLQVSGGQIVLGHWQRLLMAELDGPRSRTLRIQIIGVG